MTYQQITIRGKKYAEPSIDRMKRKQARKFQELSSAIERNPADMEITSVWDMIGILIPDLPEDVLDDLDFGECKELLESAGVMSFTEQGVPEPTEALGESSASPIS